ncbi:MAG: aldehyde dehydrogenase, partial [Nonlabens sp.]|nr:aldehyde dehydrogenase [Nonlabens sp.]
YKNRSTQDVNYRVQALKKLRDVVLKYEQDVYKALAADLGKSEFEAFLTEFNVVTGELDTYIKKTASWSKPQHVWPSIMNFPSKDRRYPEPYGCALIISPWNYPFQLAMAPLIGAVAAGNTVVLKPSEFATETSKLLATIIAEALDPAHVHVMLGDAEVSKELTALKWDYVFFTGSPGVGKIIYQAAAKHLTPVTLELGGKNPCVIHESAALKVSSRRISWAKFLNTGQTCIAPDYVLVHERIADAFINQLQESIKEQFTDKPQSSPDLGRIIRKEHYDKLVEMLDGEDIIYGGDHDAETLYMAPTLLRNPSRDSKVMQGEIFGPILPIITYSTQADLEQWITSYDTPLGAYVFTEDSNFSSWFINRFPYGGGVINDCIVQFVNERIPFGGKGNSGIGSYHGRKTFETFSHYKGVVHRGTWLDIPVKYAPYGNKLDFIKKLLRM